MEPHPELAPAMPVGRYPDHQGGLEPAALGQQVKGQKGTKYGATAELGAALSPGRHSFI